MSQHTQSQAFTRAAALRRGAATTLLLGGAGSLIDTLAAQAAPAGAGRHPGGYRARPVFGFRTIGNWGGMIASEVNVIGESITATRARERQAQFRVEPITVQGREGWVVGSPQGNQMYWFGDAATAEVEAAYLNEPAAATSGLRAILEDRRRHRADLPVSVDA